MGRDCKGFWLLFPVGGEEEGAETEEEEVENDHGGSVFGGRYLWVHVNIHTCLW